MFSLGKISELIKQVSKESMTSAAGEYDPARVFGYGFVVLASLVFLGLSIYDAIKNGHFNTTDFTTGTLAIAGAYGLVAGGVAIKKSAENPPPPPPQ